MNTFTTSYKGMRINADLYQETEGVLSNNTKALSQFLQEATSGIIFKTESGTTGYKGIFPKQ